MSALERGCARSARRLYVGAAVLLASLCVVGAARAAAITVAAHDYDTNAALTEFSFIVNQDNVRDPGDPDPMLHPSIAPTESNSPVVYEGDQGSATVDLPDGRYLISIRSPGHKLWGRHVRLPQDAGLVDIGLRSGPLPLGKIQVMAFHDNAWTNSALDAEEGGLPGFHATITEQTNSQVSVDYFNNPLCGGDCITGADGLVTLADLGPATYNISVTPPDGPCSPNPDSYWVQDSTFDGGFSIQAGVEEGSNGTGSPLFFEALWEPPPLRTAYWFGFVCYPTDFANPGTGTITGTARNWVAWPPFETLTMGDPVADPYVALSDFTTDREVFLGRGDGDGNFTIQDVPAGTYTLSIWDEQLSYIIRFVPVTVDEGGTVELGDVGVSRWFGWLEGDVYFDANRNGVRDAGEGTIPNTDVDQRWRDGSIKEETATNAAGHYQYPTAEGGPLGKWFIGEVGFTRFGTTGAAVHDEYDPSIATHVDGDMGGGLLTNQLITEGHRAEVDWGKYDYLPTEQGQIVGITFWATTRNEFDARFQAGEGYEPGIPDVEVRLEGLGADHTPNTADDPILNDYISDHYQAPNASQGASQACDVRDADGADISLLLNPIIGPNCLEVPITGEETKDGAFDGGYAFADYCPPVAPTPANPTGSTYPCDEPVQLVPGDYITHVISPDDAGGNPLYRVVAEEDVNVDEGDEFVPQIPPPPCAGDLHQVVIDPEVMPRGSPFDGQMRPLCNKRLVTLANHQNANADFFLMTNFANGADVQIPGRLVGLVSDDIYFDRDPQSIWYGEPRPIADVPIGIRDYLGRLITTVKTDENGAYEVLLPSTQTLNCPIPQGPCPGMYDVVVNDPGDKGSPNASFKPNYLTASLAWDVWPGKTTQLDTPLDPISGTACELPLNQPELLQVSRPFVLATNTTAASRRITIQGDFFGTTPGSVTLTDPRGVLQSRTFATVNANPAVGAGGIVSWSNRQIVLQVPATAALFLPGPRQLSIRTAGAAGQTTTNGLTLHVLGTVLTNAYNPPVVAVGPPTTPHAIQNAVDAAAAGSLLVLQPGIYHENVILWKRLTLQGVGVGGIIGASELLGRQPDDPRQLITGSVIDGRFFAGDRAAWLARLAAITSGAPAGLAGVDAGHPVLEGAGVTVVAKTPTAFSNGTGSARIDGIGIQTGQGQGAGGIQLQAYATNLQITNDVLEHNGGVLAGGIGVGQPYVDGHNANLHVLNTRVLGNGGINRSGGIGLFRGSDNYEVGSSVFCANFGVEYGAGVSQWGLSPGGRIHDNRIYYNDAVDSGAGIAIQQEVPRPEDPPVGTGSGAVNVDRNLIQSNYSGDDGGGIFVSGAHTARINIRNNMIVDNGAADLGAVMLDDSTNVAIVNNTIANNVSTASAEDSDGAPHSAGLASEANDPAFQATLPANAPDFSNPVALFNNIFWQNNAFTLSQPGPGATLVDQGFIDLEVRGTTVPRTFTPRYSMLTVPYGPAGQANQVGVDPLFVTPFILELAVAGSRLDPQTAAVTITGQDPPVGLTGDYHVTNASPAIDRGAGYSNFPAALNAGSTVAPCSAPLTSNFPADYDGQYRPQVRTLRLLTPWDVGADEVPGLPVLVLPFSCAGTTG